MLIKSSNILVILTGLAFYLASNSLVSADEITISGNGSSSDNQANVSQNSESNITQNNYVDVTNNVNVSTDTGNNQVSDNTNGNTAINTGESNTRVAIENSGNQSTVNSGCCNGSSTNTTISGNGSDSSNQTSYSANNQINVVINQDSTIKNNIQGNANTGGNTALGNNGDVAITTGNIRVSESIKNHYINVADVGLSGQGSGQVNLKISGNGSNSSNTANFRFDKDLNLFINNTADITNSSLWNLNTGNNDASFNLGNVLITTGDIDFESKIKNGPINVAIALVSCCEEKESQKPVEKPKEQKPQGGQPGNPTPSGGGGGNGGGGGGGGQGGSVLGLTTPTGNVLPVSGSYWLMIMTLLSGLLFAGGWYLRLHPGNSPGILAVS